MGGHLTDGTEGRVGAAADEDVREKSTGRASTAEGTTGTQEKTGTESTSDLWRRASVRTRKGERG